MLADELAARDLTVGPVREHGIADSRDARAVPTSS
jgi:hypothetical protein